MRKSIILMILCSIVSFEALASSVRCTGTGRGGKRIIFSASGDMNNRSNGSGSVVIDGEVVAEFRGEELNLNLLMRSFSIENSQGDSVSGRITNLISGEGVITNLTVQRPEVQYTNLPVQCVAR